MSYQFGKKTKLTDPRTLQIRKYLDFTALPPLPTQSANLSRVYGALGTSDPSVVFPMDGNDTVGDCTIAALAHLVTMINAFMGRKVIPTQQQCLDLYFQLTGGDDTGLDLLTVMNYVRQNGFFGEQPIVAFAEMNLKNKWEFRQVLALFGFAYIGFVVPRKCITQFDAGGPWTPGPLTADGHCVVAADYDLATGLMSVETWGAVIGATWPWESECLDEAYVLLPSEALRPGYMPGFNSELLLDDLKLVTQ